jgi:putative ATP-binding cassette transporter
VGHFLSLATQFWTGHARRAAWVLTAGLLACLVANVLLALAINLWNKSFFDALQVRDQAALLWCIVFVIVLSVLTYRIGPIHGIPHHFPHGLQDFRTD